ncbi:hypothetical protein Tco_0380879, partial [Tanacetum coccineum]
MFIKSRIYLDGEYVIMTCKYFLEYTQLEMLEFHDTLIQHMESVKKSIDKRALHKRKYDSKVNERQMQTTEEEVDTSKALDASLVNTEISRTEFGKQDTSSSSRNDADADDVDIKPVYDEVAKLLKENESLKKHYKELSDSIKTARAKTIEHTTSLIAQNADFKAKLQEKGFA